MCANKSDNKPNFLLSVLQNKCPRCRRGNIYVYNNPYKPGKFMKMHDKCPVCKQQLDMEPGFYYGTGFVSYGLAVALCVATFIAFWVLVGFSLHDNRFFWWMGVNAVFLLAVQPPIMRVSRTIWLAFFVHYSPNWDKGDIVHAERVNKTHMNNW